jgi:hypothetical protein
MKPSQQTAILATAAALIVTVVVALLLVPRTIPAPEPVPEPPTPPIVLPPEDNMIRLTEPVEGAKVTSPLTVRGMARGTWFFEASFPLVLTDWDGKIIAQSYAQFTPDTNNPESTWMTEEFIPFEGTITFENPSFPNTDASHFSHRGTLILQKDNPSGLPELDDAREITVIFE